MAKRIEGETTGSEGHSRENLHIFSNFCQGRITELPLSEMYFSPLSEYSNVFYDLYSTTWHATNVWI